VRRVRRGARPVAERDPAGENWDLVITAKRGWLDIDLAGVWRYRDLVLLLFKRDFVALYKQTILGPLWHLVQPLLTTLVFTLIFSRVAQIPTDGIPPFLFYMAGIVVWNFFSACLSATSNTFTANAAIFGKVYFPRLVVPVAAVFSNALTFVLQFLLLLACVGYYWTAGAIRLPGAGLLLVLPLLAYLGLLALGVGMIVSSVTTRFRDLVLLLVFAIQLWMFASPVVYPLSQVPESWRALFLLNPMVAPLETFRAVLLGAGAVTAQFWAASAVLASIAVLFGLVLFSRAERNSMDTV
jgi:lipopolysaccharide transport system permease protein